MHYIKKISFLMTLLLIIILSTSCGSITAINDKTTIALDKAPVEIALSMTSNPATAINVNWTTIDTTLTNPMVMVWEAGKEESTAVKFIAQVETRDVTNSTISSDKDSKITKKNFDKATITGLKANKEYNYRCGVTGAMSGIKHFKTAPDSNDEYTFIYVSDPQVSGNHSKAWNANLDMAKHLYPNARYIYIAGDFTDIAADEGEWESFFNQPGNEQYNETFSGSLISDIPIVATMGNHDGINAGVGGIASHFNFESSVNGVPISYAFDYGTAHMIILNLENAYSQNSNDMLTTQTNFLRNEVAKAKKDGKWVIVGFHKAIYSGANHMDDTDVIFNRKYWSPILAELNVDVVLQGHDHVLSRGFVKADGTKADVTEKVANRAYTAEKPNNAPLYYVGNTGGSLKFYPPIMNNDWIKSDDPVALDFGYLDINSALPVGYTSSTGQVLNEGPCTNDELEGTNSDFYRSPTFTAVTVSKDSIEFKTYMTGFNPNTNAIVHDTFMYDNLTITRP